MCKMYRHMVIVVAQPGEWCAQNIFDIAYEVDFYVFGLLLFKSIFFFRAGGVEDEVIQVHSNVYFLTLGWHWWQESLRGGCWVGETLFYHA